MPRFFSYLQTAGGGRVELLSNRSVTGEDTASIRTSGQLSRAVADIDSSTDTRVVTIDIGANDRNRYPQCVQNWGSPNCPFASNFAAILDELNAALQRDVEAEKLIVLTYYNPSTGRGGSTEASYDLALLGSDGRIDCAGTGAQVGLNDRIACIGRDKGALVADTYPAFKAGGPSFIAADNQHPSDAGHAAIAGVLRATYGTVTAITSLRLTPNEFRVASGAARIAVRSGTTVSYTLTAPATVHFTVERLATGRKVGGQCVAPSASNRDRAPCTRAVRVRGSITDSGAAGSNSFGFTGRLNGKPLEPHRYRLLAVARAGAEKSEPVARAFRIVR